MPCSLGTVSLDSLSGSIIEGFLSLLTRLVYWFPPILWTGLILAASGGTLSSGETSVWLGDIIRLVTGRDPNPLFFEFVHFSVRKAAHVIEYSILSLFFFRAIRQDRGGWTMRWAMITVFLCILVSIGDETLQSMTLNRSGTPWDVALDVAAAALAQLMLRRRTGA